MTKFLKEYLKKHPSRKKVRSHKSQSNPFKIGVYKATKRLPREIHGPGIGKFVNTVKTVVY